MKTKFWLFSHYFQLKKAFFILSSCQHWLQECKERQTVVKREALGRACEGVVGLTANRQLVAGSNAVCVSLGQIYPLPLLVCLWQTLPNDEVKARRR